MAGGVASEGGDPFSAKRKGEVASPSAVAARVEADGVDLRNARRLVYLVGSSVYLGLVGLYLDTAWHRTFPVDLREDFFSPPHLFIYALAAIGAVACLLSLLVPAFRSVHRLVGTPFRLPPLAFEVSAPFLFMGVGSLMQLVGGMVDERWHSVLGADETAWSYPHMLAVFGGTLSALGVLLALGGLGRVEGRPRVWVSLLFVAGLMTAMPWLMGSYDTVASAETQRWLLGRPEMVAIPGYQVSTARSLAMGASRMDPFWPPVLASLVFPLFLVVARRLSGWRWAGTGVAGLYTGLRVGFSYMLSPASGRWPLIALPHPLLPAALLFDLTYERLRWVSGALVGVVLAGLHGVLGGGVSPLALVLAPAAGAGSALAGGAVVVLWVDATPRRTAAALLVVAGAAPFILGGIDIWVRYGGFWWL